MSHTQARARLINIYNMPRRPRIEEAGYHHVINRGVARGDIFLQEKDYEIFLEIVQTAKER